MEENNLQDSPGEPIPAGVEQPQDEIKRLKGRVGPIAAVVIGLGGGFFLYQILGGLLSMLIFGMDFKNADMNAVRLLQIGGQILFMLLPSLILANYIYGNVTTVIRFRLPSWQELALFSAGIFILTILVNGVMVIQQYWFDVWAANSTYIQSLKKMLDTLNQYVETMYKQLMTVHSFFDGVIVIATVAVAPAICEEVLFRGYTQTSLQVKYSKFTAAIVTAAIFAVFHFNPMGIVGLFVLGLYFGWAAYKTNSILVPVVLHFLNNFVAVLAYIGVGQAEIELSTKITEKDLVQGYMTTMVMLTLFIGVVFLIKRYYNSVELEKNS
ncbi:MAG: CPBP family intramembrane metalloprotease [Ignavibacteriales bacterium]|nr:CPBP family intramembrane metalloprotease [Ignavibacteriales bacterium]